MSAPTNDQVNVGLALSGGGIRALVFHLGVFKCLAEIGYWERISIISSVSGGSLAVGLILALGNGQWPSSVDFLTETLSAARQTVTGQDIQSEYVKRVLLNPFKLLGGRANIVGNILQSAWGLKGSGLLGVEARRWSTAFPFYLPPKRLIDIATDQTRALRARDLIGFFAEDPARGRYLYIANSVPEIFRRAKKPVSVDCEVYQSDNDIEFCKRFKTTLHAPSKLDYDRLFVRGYEVAKATVQAY